MSVSVLPSSRRAARKLKTGCATCRTRKIKCDEAKPQCRRCTTTGRMCEGYDSLFRSFHAEMAPQQGKVQSSQRQDIYGNADIQLLGQYFSIKTLCDVQLRCSDDAKSILEASMTDPDLQNAVNCLKALRKDMAVAGDGSTVLGRESASFEHGLKLYSKALRGLTLKMSKPSHASLQSALLCCQVFIGIEQARAEQMAMTQHMILGLQIMREHRARPSITMAGEVRPAGYEQLPYLDAYIVRLVAAPCRFTDPTRSRTMSPADSAEPGGLPVLAPDFRKALERIAVSILELLDSVTLMQSPSDAEKVLIRRTELLIALLQWKNDPRLAAAGAETSEPISMAFMHFFHDVLRLVLVGTAVEGIENDVQAAALQLQEAVRGVESALDVHLRPEARTLQPVTSINPVKMHFLLIGASGRTGKHVVNQVLAQGHTATALIRNEKSLDAQAGLTTAIGSPTSRDDIRRAVSTTTPSAAIFTLNASRASESPFAKAIAPPRLLTDSCQLVCEELAAAGVRRIVVMSTVGVGDSWGSLNFIGKAFMGLTNIKHALRDHSALDEAIRRTLMDWTLVRAVMLKFDDPKKPQPTAEVQVLPANGKGMGMVDSVRDANVARFLTEIAVKGLYLQEAVVVRDK